VHEILDCETASKVFFLCDLLLLKDHYIFFERQKIERITMLALGYSYENLEEDILEIREMMNNR
jgi:hypothetical protein